MLCGKLTSIFTDGSNEIIRTVLSLNPTARNRDICSPEGALANAMQTTSEGISFLSLNSFNCPVYNNTENFTIKNKYLKYVRSRCFHVST